MGQVIFFEPFLSGRQWRSKMFTSLKYFVLSFNVIWQLPQRFRRCHSSQQSLAVWLKSNCLRLQDLHLGFSCYIAMNLRERDHSLALTQPWECPARCCCRYMTGRGIWQAKALLANEQEIWLKKAANTQVLGKNRESANMAWAVLVSSGGGNSNGTC